MQKSTPTLQAMRKQFETAQSLGHAMLACNAVLVPEGYSNIYLLITNFQRPIVTNHDAADWDLARGLQTHTASLPKTNFESQWTLIETESGMISQFAESIVTKHKGILPKATVYDGFIGNGDKVQGDRSYELLNCAITFTDGGGEIDAASRSQVLQVQASCRYNFFGDTGKLGSNGKNDIFANKLAGAIDALGNLTPSITSDNVTIYG